MWRAEAEIDTDAINMVDLSQGMEDQNPEVASTTKVKIILNVRTMEKWDTLDLNVEVQRKKTTNRPMQMSCQTIQMMLSYVL